MTDRHIVARDIMVTRLVTLSPEMKLREAAKLLLKNRISGAGCERGRALDRYLLGAGCDERSD